MRKKDDKNLFSNPIWLGCKKTLAGFPVSLIGRNIPGFKTAPSVNDDHDHDHSDINYGDEDGDAHV